MIFNSFNFIILYPLLFLAYYVMPAKFVRVRNIYIIAVSYLLYMNFSPAYSLLLLGITILTYFMAIKMEAKRAVGGGKYLLVVSVIATLLPLIFFKYFNFINETCYSLMQMAGLKYELQGLNWAIPVGISFYTFQAVGYLCDIWYGRVKAERDFIPYALFLSFFPSIVSGPINKASLLLPQIKAIRPYFDYCKAVGGLRMILWGMFMKVVVADRVALYVDVVFPQYQHYTSGSLFLASILYTIQIYADFAGYSLMAIGVGKTLGFELTENFRRPYFAFSVTEFWRRWHISLSTWLKDYVYIPLGGSRCSRLRNYWNIIVTFLVSGIWHGANWTFVIWGLWHGLFQVVEKATNQQMNRYGFFGTIVKIFVTFLIVNFAWIFFRMPTIEDAYLMIERMFSPSAFGSVFLPGNSDLLFISLGISLLLVKEFTDEYYPDKFRLLDNKRVWVRWTTYILCMILIMMTGVFDAGQFIYVQF